MLPPNAILILAILVFLSLIVIAVIALIFFGLRKSKSEKKDFRILLISASGSPMSGVDVKLGKDIVPSDSYGKAHFKLNPGRYELFISIKGYDEIKKTIDTSDKKMETIRMSKGTVSIELKKLDRSLDSVRKAREEIGSGYNQTIPDYLFSICKAVYDLSLEELSNQSDSKEKSRCANIASSTILQISGGLVERRNLSIYAKAKKKKLKSILLPGTPTPDILEAKNKLSAIDTLLTEKAGKKAISPPLVLWKISQELLEKPDVFNITLSMFLLDSTEKMVKELGDYLV